LFLAIYLGWNIFINKSKEEGHSLIVKCGGFSIEPKFVELNLNDVDFFGELQAVGILILGPKV